MHQAFTIISKENKCTVRRGNSVKTFCCSPEKCFTLKGRHLLPRCFPLRIDPNFNYFWCTETHTRSSSSCRRNCDCFVCSCNPFQTDRFPSQNALWLHARKYFSSHNLTLMSKITFLTEIHQIISCFQLVMR